MKRLRRWLFNGFAGLSLLMFLASGVGWIRSYSVEDTFSWFLDNQNSGLSWKGASFVSSHGKAAFVWKDFENNPPMFNWPRYSGLAHDKRDPEEPDCSGFDWHANFGGCGMGVDADRTQMIFYVPFGFLMLVFAGFPVIWWRTYRRKLRHGICPACGYDLRATPDCCPECGMTSKSVKDTN